MKMLTQIFLAKPDQLGTIRKLSGGVPIGWLHLFTSLLVDIGILLGNTDSTACFFGYKLHVVIEFFTTATAKSILSNRTINA